MNKQAEQAEQANKQADKGQGQALRHAVYARTSRDDPDDPRLSTSSQVLEAEAMAGGIDPLLKFVEISRSGSLPPTRWISSGKPTKANHRPELERLMKAIETGKVNALIVYRRDRLFRNLELSLRFYHFLQSHNVKLYATGENVGDGVGGELAVNILMVFAEHFLKISKENTRKAKQRQKREGLKMGHCPLGYRETGVKGQAEIDPTTKPVVLEVFSMWNSGKAKKEIGRFLIENSPSKKSRLNKYAVNYDQTIVCMLKNPAYIGMAYGEHGELIPSKAYPAIMPIPEWEFAQQNLQTRKGTKAKAHGYQYVMSGLLRCGYCGASMFAQPKYTTKYLKQHKTAKQIFVFRCRTPHKTLGNHPAQIQVFRWEDWALENYCYPEPVEDTFTLQDDLRLQLDSITERQKFIDAQLADVQSGLTLERYKKMTTLLQEKAKQIESEIEQTMIRRETQIQTAKQIQDAREEWLFDLSYDVKRKVLQDRIERIDVYQDHVRVTETGGEIAVYPIIKRFDSKSSKNANRQNFLLPDDTTAYASSLEWH